MRISYMQIMNNLIQIGLTVSLAALVPLLLRRVLKKRYPARAVCLVWALLALRLLVPVQLTLPEAPVRVTPRTNYVMQDDRMLFEQAGLPVEQTPARWVTDEQAAALSHANTSQTTTFNLTAVLLGLWLAGVGISAIRQAVSYGILKRRLDRTAGPAERADLLDVLASQRSGLGISRKIPLLISPAADCPMLAGFIRPALYLPDENISAADAAFIFRHELTHCRHGDLWLKLLLTAAQCVHWFNPLVYLIVRFAQEDIELACDDAVVRGQNAAYRRAYGETILRSAIAQSRRRQALVSCFGDDKKTLMRRFEGLFDKSVKKRGAALIVLVALLTATLGGTIAVGTKKDPAAAEARAVLMANTFAQAYVDEDTEAFNKYLVPNSENLVDNFTTGAAVYKRYVTKYEPETQTALIVYEYEYDADRMKTWGIEAPVTVGVPYREAQRLYFTGEGDKMLISKAIWEVSNDLSDFTPDDNHLVQSLDDFKTLYENDLGLPDFFEDDNEIGDSSNAVQAAEIQLGIFPAAGQIQGSDEEPAPYNDIRKVTFTFKDNSKVIITMIGGRPQDWTDGSGVRSRTAADLAQQYARGLLHKSGQYIYPILTPEKQQEFISQQYDMTGGTQWTWKFGSSSPSVRDYVLVPSDDDSAYRIICRMDGGGIGDVRTGYLVQTTRENGGRRMISDVTELSDADMTQSELFRLYYSTGLALPSLPDEVGNFSGLPRTDSLTAAQDAFYYFGNPVDGSKTGWIADVTQIQSIVRSDIRGGAYADIVQLTFTDGSDPINIQMEKIGTVDTGYWKPTGIQEDVSAMSGANVLPVSADAFGAISFANLPTLNTGDIIIFNFGSKPVGGVHLVNHLVDAAGRIRYQNMTDDETTLTRTNSGYVYTIPQSVSELLASDLSVPFYHALTLEYTDAQHIRHTAVAAYMTNAMTQLENPPLPSGGYYSDALGCTLKLPQEFRNAVSANINNTDGTMTFFVKDTDSVLMTLTAQLLSVLEHDFGENWAENYPVPVRPLAERDGLAYFLIYPSDVQYDPADEQAAARYQTLFEAAQSISPEDIALDADPHDTSAYAERATAVLLGYLDAGVVDGEAETALFDELDHRAQADGVSFSAAMQQAGENAQALWQKHLANES